MLLALLGACAVVGPFWGPEWEPVRGLLSEDHSCKDPRCCGNLLVLCLFLIWQVRHYWHQVTRTHRSRRKFIKVPQKWAVPSMRHDTCFRLTPEFFFSPGKFRGLDAHARRWAQSKSREYWRSLEESWTQYLLSCQRPCQGLLWDAYTSSDHIFCTTSFPSTSMLPRDSSWEAWQVPWCCSDDQTHLICKPRPPALDMCQRMEQLLVHPQEELVPLEHIVSMRCHPTSMTPLPNLPSAQSLPFCSREFLLVPSNQRVGMPTWKSLGCPQEACAPGMENQTLGKEASRESQIPGWAKKRESGGDNAWKIQAPGRQLPINFGMEDMAESKVLDWGSQSLVVSKAVGEILTPWWESQDRVQVESRVEIQELWKRSPGDAGGDENLPETQACRGKKVEQLRCKIDAETQTPMWETQDRKRDKDAIETQSFENKKEARGEDEGKNEAQGLRKKGQTRSENGEDTQFPGWGKQEQITGDTSIEIQAEERRQEDQGGGENMVQIQISWKENLGEVKNEDGIKTQALGWGKQECIQNENVTEIQTPGWEKQDQDGSEKAGKIQVCRAEIQKQLRHEPQVEWSNQGIKRGEDAGESQISRRNNLREIREEDWVVIQARCWGDQKPVGSEIDREFKTPCWGSEDQISSEHRAEIQALEKRDQRKDRDEDDKNTLAPEAESQRQLRGVTHVETHPSGMRNQEQFGDETSTDTQATGKKNLRELKGEDSKETQELREENQHQLNSEINGNIHIPKWKNQEHIRSKDGKNTQASEAENWGESASKIDVETNSAKWKKEEQVGGENGAEIQAPEKRNQREAGGEDGIETWTPGEENQSHLRDDTEEKTHLSDRKNHEQMGGENETETQTPEKTDQREPRGEDGVETQRLERENEEQLDGETGSSHSPGGRNWEQTRGMDDLENPTLEKKSQREVGSKDGTNIQRLGGGKQRLLKSNVNEIICSPEWVNQQQIGGENGAGIQIQGKSNLKGITGDDGKTQAHGGDYQGELRSETDGEIQIQGQGNQNKGEEEDAAEIRDVGSQRKCRAEDAGRLRVPRQRNKGQVRGKDAAEGLLQVDCSGGEGPPALSGSDYGARDQEQAVAAATHPEMKALPDASELFLLASGEGEHLASQSTATAGKPRVHVITASRQARPKPQRSRQRDRRVDPGKTADRTGQLPNPQSLTAPLGLPSACPSVSCGHPPLAATAPLGGPTAVTVLPKRPVLKKSQRQLLESLMRRKIAHLKWGLPQRILESYLHVNVLGPRPLPLPGQRLPGLHMACELQGQQKSEARGSRSGLKSEKVRPREGKSSKPPTQARALEEPRRRGLEPMGNSLPPVKPKRVRPPGGAREPQDVQKEAPPRAELAASRNPRPAAESSNWCGQERVQEPSSENSRGRKMVRLGISRMTERTSRRLRISYPRAGHDYWRREHTSQQPLRFQCQQPSHRSRGSLEPEECRGVGQQPSSCSTDTFSFKRSLHSAAARLSMTFLNKGSRSPHLAKAQHSAPNLSVRDPGPTLLPRVDDPRAREGSISVHTSLKRDLQPPGHCGAGAPLLKTEELEEVGNPRGALWNPPDPRKSGLMKCLRGFLLQHGFRK